MNQAGKPLLAGIISQTNLLKAEMEPKSLLRSNLLLCDALEIRYDLFESVSDWPLLAARVRSIQPQSKIIGTIRLKSDGGCFDDAMIDERLMLWESILNASVVPDWLDFEELSLSSELDLKSKAERRGTKIFVSKHDFHKIPSYQELLRLADTAEKAGACGIKVAAMSFCEGDSAPLYEFLKGVAGRFEWRAAFAMGESGSASRVWSLCAGANLTYGNISDVSVPGLLSVKTMRSAIDHMSYCETESELGLFIKNLPD